VSAIRQARTFSTELDALLPPGRVMGRKHPTHRETQDGRAGPLRNGNPRGNPNLAQRCLARTRAGCPGPAPAMRNGRCRMHGGAATGARTQDGIARIRAATTTHRFYSTEGVADRRRTDAFIAEARALLAAVRADDVAT
jgi:hypothetical protein